MKPALEVGERRSRLATFLRWFVPVVAAFGVVEAAVGLRFADPPTLTSGLVILGYAAVTGLAVLLNRSGRTESASIVLAVGIVATALLLVRLQPELHPALALVPLLGAALAYPYLAGRPLAAVLFATTLATAAIVLAGETLPSTTRVPGAFAIGYRAAGSAAVAGFVALFLWQNRRRHDARLAAAEKLRDGLEAELEALRTRETAARNLAFEDPVTHLPNRLLFFESLAREIAASRRHGKRCAVIFADLDGFKAINDSYGHDAGDAVLGEVGARLRDELRGADVVARWGGDEFTILLPRIGSSLDLDRVVGRIFAALAPGVEVQGRLHPIGASLGLALFPDHADTPQALVRAADMAMYRAKSAGGAHYAWAGEGPIVSAPGARGSDASALSS